MPQLLLIRHAKAGNAPLDKDRPLTGRGARDAAAVGTWLASAGRVPDLVLVSPARRAVETWAQAAAALRSAPESVAVGRLYDNTLEDLLAVIREAPEDVERLAVVGHNPSIGALAYELDDGRGTSKARKGLERGFPTGGVAVFDLTTSFADIDPDTGTLRDFRVPEH